MFISWKNYTNIRGILSMMPSPWFFIIMVVNFFASSYLSYFFFQCFKVVRPPFLVFHKFLNCVSFDIDSFHLAWIPVWKLFGLGLVWFLLVHCILVLKLLFLLQLGVLVDHKIRFSTIIFFIIPRSFIFIAAFLFIDNLVLFSNLPLFLLGTENYHPNADLFVVWHSLQHILITVVSEAPPLFCVVIIETHNQSFLFS